MGLESWQEDIFHKLKKREKEEEEVGEKICLYARVRWGGRGFRSCGSKSGRKGRFAPSHLTPDFLKAYSRTVESG